MTDRDYNTPLSLELVEDPIPSRPASQHFMGAGVETVQDELRLDSQYNRILRLMRDGEFRTLAAISMATGYPEGSILRQLSYADDPWWNSGYRKVKRRIGPGLWEYRLVPTEAKAESIQMAAYKASWPGGPNP